MKQTKQTTNKATKRQAKNNQEGKQIKSKE